MSLSTTLRLVNTIVPAGSQATDRTANQRHTLQQPTPVVSPQHPARTLEAVLLLVSQDVAGLEDPVVISLLTTLTLGGRPVQDWMDQQTTVHVVFRAYVQDPRVGRPLGQQMFRRLLGDLFAQDRITSAPFEADCGGAGVIVAQWRSEALPCATATHQRQSEQVTEHPAIALTAFHAAATTSISHWSWWAERALVKESFA
jgi:hypothetical protein